MIRTASGATRKLPPLKQESRRFSSGAEPGQARTVKLARSSQCGPLAKPGCDRWPLVGPGDVAQAAVQQRGGANHPDMGDPGGIGGGGRVASPALSQASSHTAATRPINACTDSPPPGRCPAKSATQASSAAGPIAFQRRPSQSPKSISCRCRSFLQTKSGRSPIRSCASCSHLCSGEVTTGDTGRQHLGQRFGTRAGGLRIRR